MGEVVVGVDLGGTKVYGVVVDPIDPTTVLAEARVPTPAGSAAIIEAISALVHQLAPEPAALGVGIAGLVDRRGVLRTSPNLPGVQDLDLGRALASLAPIVEIDNDNTCATWAEFRIGAGTGYDDGVFVGLGTGLGAGVVAGGSLVRGAHGFAGEAGHIVIEPGGVDCPCGQSGCWERYASGAALARYADEQVAAGTGQGYGTDRPITGERVSRAFRAGDSDAIAAVRRLAHATARGLATLIAVLDPGVVVLGGGVVDDLGEDLCRLVLAALPDLVFGGDNRSPVPVLPARLGNQAGALGAALLAVSEAHR